jgi:hypothetical protein
MLEDESIIELMLAIGQHDFFVGEALMHGMDFGLLVVSSKTCFTLLTLIVARDLTFFHGICKIIFVVFSLH